MKDEIIKRVVITAIAAGFIAGTASAEDVHKVTGKVSFSFAFITDAHITSNLDPIREWELPVAREELTETPFVGYQRVLEEIKSRSVDFILNGGDYIDLNTFDGKKIVADDLKIVDQYIKRIKGIEKSIGLPMYYAIGNHDLYEYPPAKPDHPFFGQGLFSEYFMPEGKSYYSFDTNGWHFISLSSQDVLRHGWFWQGLSDEQLEWLKSDLEHIDKQTPIVLMSHVPFPDMKTADKNSYVGMGETVYQIIKDHNVKLALFGHEHAYREFMWNDIPCVVGPSLSGSVWIAARGGCHNKGGQGYVVLTVAGGAVSWKYYPFIYNIEQYRLEQSGKGPSAVPDALKKSIDLTGCMNAAGSANFGHPDTYLDAHAF